MLRRRSGQVVDARVDHLERRLDDVEDTVAAALDRTLVDDLAIRVEELHLGTVTHDDLLEVRVSVARLTDEITRVRAEVHDQLDRIAALLLDLTEERYSRREAG